MQPSISIPQRSIRRMVRQLHFNTMEQRQTVQECRRQAEALREAPARVAGTAPTAVEVDTPPAVSVPTFSSVASEAELNETCNPNGNLSGVAVAVADALEVMEFRNSPASSLSGLPRVPQLLRRAEFPLISWLRRQGAQFVGKLSCRTPLALSDGCLFGAESTTAVAVSAGACHYAIDCSLIGPAAVASAASHDVVGFKPTAQTFGTFTERFQTTIPSMTLGVTANRVDDLLYLWQVYTAAVDPEANLRRQQAAQRSSTASPAQAVAMGLDGDIDGWDAASEGAKKGMPLFLSRSAYRQAVHDRRGKIADIDVGWRDYNAESTEDDFGRDPGGTVWSRLLHGDRQRYMTPRVELAVGYPTEWIDQCCRERYGTAQAFHVKLADAVYARSALHKNQRMEIVPLAFDFHLDEIKEACRTISHYELAGAFGRRQAETAEMNSEVVQETDVSSGKDSTRSQQPTPITTTTTAAAAATPTSEHVAPVYAGNMDDFPPDLRTAIEEGSKLSTAAYNRALRIRDDVVRATEQQFEDVDLLVVPLLSAPYSSGDMNSVALTLPFYLAGNPMLGVQMEKDVPVVLVGELGRDAALLEDAFCFMQFVRGVSPRWWRQKVFGADAQSL